MRVNEYENDLEMSDFVPWHDSTLWAKEKWYPLPHSAEAEFDGTLLLVLGATWGVYKLDPETDNGDIVPFIAEVPMTTACEIAKELNLQHLTGQDTRGGE